MEDGREKDLLRRAKSGDEAAMAELWDWVRSRVHRTINWMLEGSRDVEDVLQFVQIKVFRSIGSFDERSSFPTWVHRIAINECLDHFRKADYKRLLLLDDLAASHESAENPEDPEESSENWGFPGPSPNMYSRYLADENEKLFLDLVRRVVNDAYAGLDPREVEAYELAQVDGVPAATVANMVGLSGPQRVYDITKRLRKRMRTMLARALQTSEKIAVGGKSP